MFKKLGLVVGLSLVASACASGGQIESAEVAIVDPSEAADGGSETTGAPAEVTATPRWGLNIDTHAIIGRYQRDLFGTGHFNPTYPVVTNGASGPGARWRIGS